MGIYDEKTENKLNELIEKAYDAQKGFKKVAEHVDSSSLKLFFSEKARERSKHINELTNALRKKGMDVTDDDGSTTGSLHRTWIDLKAFFSMDDDESMLEEVKNGEKAAIEDYEDAIENSEVDHSIKDILVRQKNEIQASYNKADYLEDIH